MRQNNENTQRKCLIPLGVEDSMMPFTYISSKSKLRHYNRIEILMQNIAKYAKEDGKHFQYGLRIEIA